MLAQQFRLRRWNWNQAFLIGLGLILLLGMLLLAPLTTEAAGTDWEAKYWNSKKPGGDPVLVRHEGAIDYDWGNGSPGPGVNADNFSVRWKRTIDVSGGIYRYTATMDDGMRVWVDDQLIIDSWYDSQPHTISADITLTPGQHQVKVEYYDSGGGAVAKLSQARIGNAQSPTIYNWRGEYFNNVSLFGAPVMVRDDRVIDFNWGGGSPEWGVVGSDQFSVRWTNNLNLSSGRYRFTTVTDDGVRLWVNGRLIIDKWIDQLSGTNTAEIDHYGGNLPVQMEYYENIGGAVARLAWVRVGNTSGSPPGGGTGGPTIYSWRGEYFNNTGLSGGPAMVRDDAQISFNWGYGSPAVGIGADNFSARWTRTVPFTAGRYRFTLTSDDGARLWVNNQLLIDRWYDRSVQSFTADIDLPNGPVPIRMEYYERSLLAEAYLSWNLISGGATPPPAPGVNTAVVASYRANVRLGPGIQYGIITSLLRGTTIQLAGYRNAATTWVMVNLPNGTQGWIYAGLLQSSTPFTSLAVWQGQVPGTGGPPTPPAGMAAATVNTAYLNCRQGPGVGFPVQTVLPRNTTVQMNYRNQAASWVRVTTPSSQSCWVNASYLLTGYPIANLPVASN